MNPGQGGKASRKSPVRSAATILEEMEGLEMNDDERQAPLCR